MNRVIAPFGTSVQLFCGDNSSDGDSSDDSSQEYSLQCNNGDKAIALGGVLFRDGTFLVTNDETTDVAQFRTDLVKNNGRWQFENFLFIGFVL